MSPQWIPQNIQKRLLLYVLHQLSLFSEIDLPNLEEVSLNNILLRDVSIDPEKVGKLSGWNLRYGQVGQLELNGGVMGGVNIDATNVELVIAPDLDTSSGSKGSTQSKFSIAQSTADLANTVMFDGDLEGDGAESATGSEQDDSVSSLGSSEESTSTSSSKPSALGGVMAKAVEIALSRLQVRIKKFSIKIVSEMTDILIEVDEIFVKTNNGTRNISISGIKVLSLNQDVNPGSNSSESPYEVPTVGESDEEENEGDYDEDDDGYGDESLMDSMVFTHEEASSIYMSANSESFAKDGTKKPALANNTPPVVFYIDEIHLNFEGLTNISNLEISVGELKVALVPLFPTVISILSNITRALKLKTHQRKKESLNLRKKSRFPQYDADDEDFQSEGQETTPGAGQSAGTQHSQVPDDEPSFKKLHVRAIVLSLTSALLANGEFASTNSLTNITLKNVHVKQKSHTLTYGGIESLSITQYIDGKLVEILKFVQASADQSLPVTSVSPTPESTPAPTAQSKADIRFELFTNEETQDTEFTLLCSKSLKVNISKDNLPLLINLGASIMSTFEHMSSLRATMDVRKKTSMIPSPKDPKIEANGSTVGKFNTIFQTALIELNIKLMDINVKTIIMPISYKSAQHYVSVRKVLIDYIENQQEHRIVTLSNIRLTTKLKEFRSYISRSGTNDRYPKSISLTSSLILTIPQIDVSISMKKLKKVLSNVKLFSSCLEGLSSAVNSSENYFKSSTSFAFNGNQNSTQSSTSVSQYSTYSNQRRPRRSNLVNSSHNLSMHHKVSFRIAVNGISVHISDVFPKFGALNTEFEKVSFDFYSGGDIKGSIHSVSQNRVFGETVDSFLREFPENTTHSQPLILLSIKRNERATIVETHLRNLCIEYYTLWLQLIENQVHEQPPVDVFIDALPHTAVKTESNNSSTRVQKKFEVRLILYDLVIGLTPGRLPCKGYVVVEKGNSDITMVENLLSVKKSLRGITLFLIDDVKNMRLVNNNNNDSDNRGTYTYQKAASPNSISPMDWLVDSGYLHLGTINCTHVGITINSDIEAMKLKNQKLGIKNKLSLVEIKINSDEHQLHLCADSAHTLLQFINDLKQPILFSDEEKYKVKLSKTVNLLEDVEDMFSKDSMHSSGQSHTSSSDRILNIVDGYYDNSALGSQASSLVQDLETLTFDTDGKDGSSVHFEENHFTTNLSHSDEGGFIPPVLMYVNASKTNIYLYDGYDWKDTRKEIKGAVQRVEEQAGKEIGVGRKDVSKDHIQHVKFEDDDNTSGSIEKSPDLISETLFQSIHLSIPAGTIPSKLTHNINKNMQNDDMKEQTPTSIDEGNSYKNLLLRRSKFHKVSIELRNLDVVVEVLSTRDPRNESVDESKEVQSEIVNSIEVKIENFQVLDNVPSSTWHKFVSYMRMAGEREISTSMLKLSLKNVRPNWNLCSTEAILDINILPLRLYVDQDTLDFLTRFGGFKDSRFHLPIDDIIYIQKFRINNVKVKLDYKPKKVDYAGIRSGHTSEFVNFFILDGAEIVLKSVTLHGILGFPSLSQQLKSIWTPDVQSTQLSGVLAGLGPIRSLVNIGSGMKDLIAIPVKEYKKDGRLVRSIQKGAFSFAKTTSSELLKLGVKLAAGTQVILEHSEEAFGGEGSSARSPHPDIIKSEIEKEEDDMYYTNNNGDQLFAIRARKPVENDLLASSQLLNQSVQADTSHYGGSRKLYSYAEIDESTSMDSHLLRSSAMMLAPLEEGSGNQQRKNTDLMKTNSADLDSDEGQRNVSLYSNQPIGAQEGLQFAYGSIGRNFKTAKVAVIQTRDAVTDAASVPEAAVVIAKAAPVILIRPIIGAAEAVSKTLLGFSNQINPDQRLESEEKYKPN
ncbi:autophagy-related protein 2 [[Candida] anglica]|uniref:Autophagy-related protein 2 n=1 Tax=[Candida] anglica TaxID=148631 RepID=A0ABP0EJ91_9ASCO